MSDQPPADQPLTPAQSALLLRGVAVRVVFTVRASKNLYGYAFGPFRYDETRGCFVYKGQTFSVDEWEREGQELLQRFHRHRPMVQVEVGLEELSLSEASAPAEDGPVAPDDAPAKEHAPTPAESTPPAAEAPPPAPPVPPAEAAPVKRVRNRKPAQ